jgi:broad specificity phosphatase PhoE
MSDSTKIFILRHGESLEDVDKKIHEKLADEDIPLSQCGILQSIAAGQDLADKLDEYASVVFYLSPSKRVRQTAELIVAQFPITTTVTTHTIPTLRKQDWGEVLACERSTVEKERYETGVLRYDFPRGESAQAFLGRLSDFVRKLNQENLPKPAVRVIITHGFEMRVVMMHMFGWTEEYFETLAHPNNCEIKHVLLTRLHGFQLKSTMRQFDPSTVPNYIARRK